MKAVQLIAHGNPGKFELRDVPDPKPGPETQYLQEEREELLWKAISGLRPSIRKVVELQLSKDCAMRETARTTGISVCAAKSRLFHAKAAIRKSLRPRTIGGAPMLRPAARFVQGTAAYRKTRNVELP